MDSLFQIAANAAARQVLASKGMSRLANWVVKKVQETRDAQDLRSAGDVMQSTDEQPPSILSPYNYEYITNNSSIRLLVLAPGQRNEPITCGLYTVDLDTFPEYEAISYCWGSPSDERKIACAQGMLSITKNLYDALQRFRDPENPRRLWVDAICVNQMDLSERTQQVRLMRRIYEQCSQCLVWLGMDEKDDYSASHLLMKLSQLRSSQRSRRCGRKPWSKLTTTTQQWAAFRKLLDRPWFIRMWTLQEIVIPRKAVMMCGKHEWEVDEFLELVKFAHNNQGEEDLGGLTYGMLQCLKIAASREMRHYNQVAASRNGLLEILRDARERIARDKRDKVFAVLGLCKEEDSQDVTPNYKDTPAEVYLRVAKVVLASNDKPLRLLSAAGLGERSNEELTLPSWIPDWSFRTTLPSPTRQFEECGKFEAGGCSKPVMQFFLSADGTEHLHLRGTIVTSLCGFVDINESRFKTYWQEENYPNKSTREKLFDIWAIMVFGPCLAPETPRSLLQWFVMKCSKGYGKRYEEDSEKYDILWQTMSREMGSGEALKNCKKRFKDYAWPPEHSKEEGGKKLAPFLHDLGIWTQSRKFCRGANGGIGWVPLAAKRGDVVCVFQGSELPHVLRRAADGESFHLVGHCYFQGIMHGTVCQNPRWRDLVLK